MYLDCCGLIIDLKYSITKFGRGCEVVVAWVHPSIINDGGLDPGKEAWNTHVDVIVLLKKGILFIWTSNRPFTAPVHQWQFWIRNIVRDSRTYRSDPNETQFNLVQRLTCKVHSPTIHARALSLTNTFKKTFIYHLCTFSVEAMADSASQYVNPSLLHSERSATVTLNTISVWTFREGVQIKKTFLNGHCPDRSYPPNGQRGPFFRPSKATFKRVLQNQIPIENDRENYGDAILPGKVCSCCPLVFWRQEQLCAR